jgi:hypothetical protein
VISVSELKALLSIAGTGQDAWLLEVERNAVAFIETQTGWYFGPPQEGYVDIVTAVDPRDLWLTAHPADLDDIEMVEERRWPGDDPVEIELGEFEPRVRDRWTRLVRLGRATWKAGHEYSVPFDRGYAAGEEPGDIRQLVIDLVAVKNSIRGLEGLRSEQQGARSWTRFGETDLDAVMGGWATIRAWKRPVYA